MLPDSLHLFVDGCDMQDGVNSSFGYVLTRGRTEIIAGAKKIDPSDIITGIEYTAILHALDELLTMGYRKESIVVHNDNIAIIKALRTLNPKGNRNGIIQYTYRFSDLEFAITKSNNGHIKKCHFLSRDILREQKAS